jgi:hypothetical protein
MLCAQARPLCSTRAGAVQLQQTTHRTKVTLQTDTNFKFTFYGTNWSQFKDQFSTHEFIKRQRGSIFNRVRKNRFYLKNLA